MVDLVALGHILTDNLIVASYLTVQLPLTCCHRIYGVTVANASVASSLGVAVAAGSLFTRPGAAVATGWLLWPHGRCSRCGSAVTAPWALRLPPASCYSLVRSCAARCVCLMGATAAYGLPSSTVPGAGVPSAVPWVVVLHKCCVSVEHIPPFKAVSFRH